MQPVTPWAPGPAHAEHPGAGTFRVAEVRDPGEGPGAIALHAVSGSRSQSAPPDDHELLYDLAGALGEPRPHKTSQLPGAVSWGSWRD